MELYAVYVRASQYGTGLGHRLLEAAIGDAPAYLWVFEANVRARGFYARQGFEPDGARNPSRRSRSLKSGSGAADVSPRRRAGRARSRTARPASRTPG